MGHHENLERESLYPYDAWKVVESSFDLASNHQDETIFAVGNGYIGMRGNFEEDYHGPIGSSLQGIYVNGFYDSEPIKYGELAYGYAQKSQTMLNVTDSKIIRLYLDDEPFDMLQGTVLSYHRELDMLRGVMVREVLFESPQKRRVQVRIKRLVSLSRRHVAAISYEVIPYFSGNISFVSAIQGEVHNQVTIGDPRVGSSFCEQVLQTIDSQQDDSYMALLQRTKNTHFSLVCAAQHEVLTTAPVTTRQQRVGQEVQWHVTAAVSGKTATGEQPVVRLDKFIAYVSSKDYATDQLWQCASDEVNQAAKDGFASLLQEQADFMATYWRDSDVVIHGDDALQQSLRFNAFHLLQSVGRDGKTNIAAKGITGEGYEGHYFWDTETYIFPFFLYTQPDIAKKLLDYRYHILDKARQRAKEMAQKGALYAWRTIDGEETSAYYPAGTAAYHINADIMYALKKYMHATNDDRFLLEKGAEMLFETARLWVDLGDYIPAYDDCFCINEVTGPDEYTALVNNNLYTNVMAKDHLTYAWTVAQDLQQRYPEAFKRLSDHLTLGEKEVASWQKAAQAMYIPYDEKLGIHPQDDSFLKKAVWDFEHTPPEHYPLLLHYHPLVIYRYQVLKQADVVLAEFLQGDLFSKEQKRRDFDYYEKITTHDSSLSPCIYSIMAAELGDLDKAYHYFAQTARMDLDDNNGNVKDGIHTASMGGTWLAMVAGFGGLREYDGQLSFRPVLPSRWQGYEFRVRFQGRMIEVIVDQAGVSYRLIEGETIEIKHDQQTVQLVDVVKNLALTV